MEKVSKIERLAPGLLSVDCVDFGEYYQGQLWSDSKARKTAKCIYSGRPIVPGDRIYRPVTNKSNRGTRMLASEVDKDYP